MTSSKEIKTLVHKKTVQFFLVKFGCTLYKYAYNDKNIKTYKIIAFLILLHGQALNKKAVIQDYL